MLTIRGPRLQPVLPGVDVLLIESVIPSDVLWVWEAKLGVPPNIHTTQQDLCRESHKFTLWLRIVVYEEICNV